ncbi:uncharacterized protein ATC70_002831 [Mucor velutinosus]|uniref:Uncharacterized protein n=1 Tax=Mucor velutinosus TaxID=708070 RepID=A0AAN7DD24_9FUNG|nr:hypothetical protein ATC70_002831 [Mucor velutinosus]
MKLRDRKKHVQGDIKKEERKSDIIPSNASPPVANAPATTNLTIKQEETKEREELQLQQPDEFGEADYDYRCDHCDRKMESL